MNKASRQYRKFLFYLSNTFQFSVLPRSFFRLQLDEKLKQLSSDNRSTIVDRINYYNKLSDSFQLSAQAIANGALRPGKKNTYIFDAHRTLRYFDPALKIDYIFGDTKIIPETPKIVKSRPIAGDNQNSVLMKLNQIRHFYFVTKDIPFEAKKNMVVWRGALGNKTGRKFLLQRHAANPLCDIGCSDDKRRSDPNYKGFLSIKDQLAFKFVLSIEGNDVATNLKWILSSNSLCLMPRPRFETWFMEGRLVPDHHYALLKDDLSDLDEKVHYYTNNPEQALRIIRNANSYVEPFRDKKQEELIQLLVMLKYFQLSKQLPAEEPFWASEKKNG